MATPPQPYNPSIDNPPLTPQPIREDPDPDTLDGPKEDPVEPYPRPKRVHRRAESIMCMENLFCLPPF